MARLVLWPRVTQAATVAVTSRLGAKVKLLICAIVPNVVTVLIFSVPIRFRTSIP